MNDDITLISSDPQEILDGILKIYKDKTGITLPISDPRKIDYNVIAYYISTVRAYMNEVAKQNFLRFAAGARLDLKGEIYGNKGLRTPEGAARTTIRCFMQSVQNRDIIIPAGTRFIKDTYVFSSLAEGIIKIGQLYTDIIVECNIPGFVPKYTHGEINEIIDIFDNYSSCENITEVIGGVNVEDDDEYRKRLREVPESFSTAGPSSSYKFWIKSSSSLVKDVEIKSPNPCYIDIYLIGENGDFISEEIKEKILFDLQDKRPQGDRVEIKNPAKIDFSINLTYFINKFDEGRAFIIDNEIKKNINDYIKNISSKMGADIDQQDIITICKNSGAKRIIINSPENINISEIEIGNCKNITINSGGIE